MCGIRAFGARDEAKLDIRLNNDEHERRSARRQLKMHSAKRSVISRNRNANAIIDVLTV